MSKHTKLMVTTMLKTYQYKYNLDTTQNSDKTVNLIMPNITSNELSSKYNHF